MLEGVGAATARRLPAAAAYWLVPPVRSRQQGDLSSLLTSQDRVPSCKLTEGSRGRCVGQNGAAAVAAMVASGGCFSSTAQIPDGGERARERAAGAMRVGAVGLLLRPLKAPENVGVEGRRRGRAERQGGEQAQRWLKGRANDALAARYAGRYAADARRRSACTGVDWGLGTRSPCYPMRLARRFDGTGKRAAAEAGRSPNEHIVAKSTVPPLAAGGQHSSTPCLALTTKTVALQTRVLNMITGVVVGW